MKQRKLLTLLLAAALILSLGIAVLADSSITQTITLSAPAETLTVTVPTSLDLQLTDEDGDGILSGSTGSGVKIVNGSNLDIKVEDIKVDLKSSWSFVTDDEIAGTKQAVAMKFGETQVTEDATGAVLARAIHSRDAEGGIIKPGGANAAALNCTVKVQSGQYIPADLISVTYTIGWK